MEHSSYIFDFDREIKFDGWQVLGVPSGLGGTAAKMKTVDNVRGEGVTITATTIESRYPKFEIEVSRELGDVLVRYFRGGSPHTLYIGDRQMFLMSERAELTYPNGTDNKPILELDFICADGLYYSVDDFGKNIAGIQPMFGFPWRATKTNGITFGYRIFTGKTNYRNDGDMEVGFYTKITASRGSCINPTFKLTDTGEFVRMNLEMKLGDVLEISTRTAGSQQPYVILNGENAYAHLDRESTLFKLLVGDNFLEYFADDGEKNLDVELRYNRVYTNGLVVD